MFFILSKVMWFLLAPLNLIAVFLGLWLVAQRVGRHDFAKFMLGCSVGIFLLLGILPAGQNGLFYLESQYTKPGKLPSEIDGILVLGGAVETGASIISKSPEFNDSVDRILAAMELARIYPKAKIVFSGGSGALIHNERLESIDMKIFLQDMGFDTTHVVYEEKSRTTYENIRNTLALVKPKRSEKWFLITSAWHMPRAMGVANKYGWGLIPYPVDYRGPGRYLLLPERFDVLTNFSAADLTLHEMTGIAAYRLTGKI